MVKKKDRVTQEDISMINYFIINKGDITRWVDWKFRKKIIQKEFPELIYALDKFEHAEKTLTRVTKNIVNGCHNHPEE